METNSKPASPLDLPDRIRAIADRLDEAFCAAANTPKCRALEPADLIAMMSVLIDIADEVETNNEVMVRVASAYEACKAAFGSQVTAEPARIVKRSLRLVTNDGDAA